MGKPFMHFRVPVKGVATDWISDVLAEDKSNRLASKRLYYWGLLGMLEAVSQKPDLIGHIPALMEEIAKYRRILNMPENMPFPLFSVPNYSQSTVTNPGHSAHIDKKAEKSTKDNSSGEDVPSDSIEVFNQLMGG